MTDSKLVSYRVVFSDGEETSCSSRNVAGMRATVWEVWRAMKWGCESVVVEGGGRKWVAERQESGWPKWKEIV